MVQAVFRRTFSCLTHSGRFNLSPSSKLATFNNNQTIWHDVTFGTAPSMHLISLPPLDKLMLIREAQFYRYTYPDRYTDSKLS